MSKLGKLLCIGTDDERFIEDLMDDLDTLGIRYPDMSDVDATNTNEIIYSLMYEIRNAFERDFSDYIVDHDIDFDLDNFQVDIRTNCLDSDYEISYVANYAKVPSSNIVAVGDKYRHITEKESWLLMGFDESDFAKAHALYPQRYIGGKECMCGILYRQAGNSIVVPVLQAIVRELKQYF